MPVFLFMCILYIDKNISFKVQITSQRRFFLLHIFKNLFYWSVVDLYLVSSASVRSILFLSFIMLTFAWNVPLVSLIFLKRSLVFPILLFSSISSHCSLKKAFLALLAIPWNCIQMSIFPFLLWVLLLFSQLFVRPLQTTILPFWFSLFGGMVLINASCTVLQTSIHGLKALFLSDLIPWLSLSLPLYNP